MHENIYFISLLIAFKKWKVSFLPSWPHKRALKCLWDCDKGFVLLCFLRVTTHFFC